MGMYSMPSLGVYSMPSLGIWIFGQLICVLIVYLVLRLATKLKPLTVLCLSLLFTAALPWALAILGPAFTGVRQKPFPSLLDSGLSFHTTYRFLPPGFGTRMFFLLNLLVVCICAVFLIGKLLAVLLREVSSSARVNTAERQRILRMVEDDKISAEEGSELLDAMGRADAFMGQDKFSRLDIVMLCGVALVVLGFFLPWAHIRMRSALTTLGQVSGYQAGYDAGAIGWAVFIIGVLSAVPVFVTPKHFLYKISIMQIYLTLVGLVIVVSVLVRTVSYSGVGLIFCLVGFMIELVASGTKIKRLAV
ncbi:MAG: SHOCT-like domain-containing protein [Planctomycetota bacterium]